MRQLLPRCLPGSSELRGLGERLQLWAAQRTTRNTLCVAYPNPGPFPAYPDRAVCVSLQQYIPGPPKNNNNTHTGFEYMRNLRGAYCWCINAMSLQRVQIGRGVYSCELCCVQQLRPDLLRETVGSR